MGSKVQTGSKEAGRCQKTEKSIRSAHVSHASALCFTRYFVFCTVMWSNMGTRSGCRLAFGGQRHWLVFFSNTLLLSWYFSSVRSMSQWLPVNFKGDLTQRCTEAVFEGFGPPREVDELQLNSARDPWVYLALFTYLACYRVTIVLQAKQRSWKTRATNKTSTGSPTYLWVSSVFVLWKCLSIRLLWLKKSKKHPLSLFISELWRHFM